MPFTRLVPAPKLVTEGFDDHDPSQTPRCVAPSSIICRAVLSTPTTAPETVDPCPW